MILDEIIAHKKKEVEQRKNYFPLDKFKNDLKKSESDFKGALQKEKIALIAEIKRASPSEGIIRENFNLNEIVQQYKQADALSVITDKKFFQGSIDYLARVRELTKKPLLRKDFIIDHYQIYEARHYGADAILLIAACLNSTQIDYFIKTAKSYKMDCLVEVHNKDELRKAMWTNAEIIGINNRDLQTFTTDLNTTLELSDSIPKDKIIISESGIKTQEDMVKLHSKAHAVLIGTTFMKEENIQQKVREVMNYERILEKTPVY